MTLLYEIKSSIAKLKKLEKNESENNTDMVITEIENEKRKLNELFKIARQENLKAPCIQFAGYAERR